MTALEILDLATPVTIQDHGRMGYRRFGVPAGGAIDHYALAEGQALLGNTHDSAALEMSFQGGQFKASAALHFATSGAEMALAIDRSPVPWRTVQRIEAGQTLTIGPASLGNYGYLHLKGGIEAPVALSSRSTHIPSGIGWQPQVGEHLVAACDGECAMNMLPQAAYFNERVLRVLPGPQTSLFPDTDLQTLASGVFRTGFVRDRMGVRLETDETRFQASAGRTVISDPIMTGDIQVTADGVGTVLLADSQPTGGYPRLATVIGADLPVIAQMPPGAEFTFRLIERDEAIRAWRAYMQDCNSLARAIRPLVRNPHDINDLLSYDLVSGLVRGDESDAD